MPTIKALFIFSFVTSLTACGSGSSGKNDAGKNDNNTDARKVSTPGQRVQWDSIPREYNPSVEDHSFSLTASDRLKVNMFGFKDDVEIVYSSSLSQDAGYLRLYKVWKESVTWGEIKQKKDGQIAKVENNGNYQCSISIENGNIKALKGGCYIRLQIFMPQNSKVEVYNSGELLSERMIPITADELIDSLDEVSLKEQKLTLIAEFIASYKNSTEKPRLSADQLGKVIKEFSFSDEKFEALKQLHSYVVERDRLKPMIEAEFSYFDREKALQIVGLAN